MREVATQRLACDRCHGQKLRCSRSSQAAANGACQRCIKAKAHCQYSSPLRLGRPANKPPDLAKQGRRRSSNALPSPYESVSDASERQLEESYVNGLPQLDYPSVHEAEAPPLQEGHNWNHFPLKSFHWDDGSHFGHSQDLSEIPNQTHDGVYSDPSNPKPELSYFSMDSYSTQPTPESTHSIHTQPSTSSDAFHFDEQGSTWAARLGTSIDSASVQGFPPNTSPSMQAQPGVNQEDAQRQLLDVLRRLHETPHHSPAALNGSTASTLNPQLMDETVKAADKLIGIFDALQICALPASPIEPSRLPNAGTGLLIAACYEHIFRNSHALATVLHDAVYSNDMSTLSAMPSIKIGSAAASTHTTSSSPAIQSALWAQLLWQSLRELEKRLLTLSLRPGMSSPPPPPPPPHAAGSFGPGPSHLVDLTAAADAEVSRLEFGVNHLLETTLDALRRKSI